MHLFFVVTYWKPNHFKPLEWGSKIVLMRIWTVYNAKWNQVCFNHNCNCPTALPLTHDFFFAREKVCKNWHSECRWLISRIMTRQQSLSTQHHRLVWSEKLLHGLGCSESLSATSSSSHRDSVDKNSCDFRSKRNDCRKKNSMEP